MACECPNVSSSAIPKFQLTLDGTALHHKWAWNDEAARLHVLRALVHAGTRQDMQEQAAWACALPTMWQIERQLFIVSRGNRHDYLARACELFSWLKEEGLDGINKLDVGGSMAWILDQPRAVSQGSCTNLKAQTLSRLACLRLEPPADIAGSTRLPSAR